MSHTPEHEPPDVGGADWAVYQCPHGCLHVRLNNVTLTFTGAEFLRLVHLLADASARLAAGPPPSRLTAH